MLFKYGKIVATPGAAALLAGTTSVTASRLLFRHVSGDFGDMCADDVDENNYAIANGLRVMSAYPVAGEKLWVITEADRSVTTFLLPEEY